MVATLKVKEDMVVFNTVQRQWEYVVTKSENEIESEVVVQYGIKAFNPTTNDEYYSLEDVFCNDTDADNFIAMLGLEFIEKEQMVYILEDYLS